MPETATLEPLEVPVEPRSAAVERVAAPVEPVLAPVDKGSNYQRPCLSPGGLPFLLAALPRFHILMMPGTALNELMTLHWEGFCLNELEHCLMCIHETPFNVIHLTNH